ncbi:MAG: hypothetical protein A2428_00015 [Bdellovibrionales bacterium RIFOXYC1_FULL_54_43]|nr:MAG: hypothetical protein A2428_00015 [Bdellovibrionales bacterium RIFOXYC1_FULL_54_43]
MFARLPAVLVFSGLLTGLVWWSGHLNTPPAAEENITSKNEELSVQTLIRQDLIETLDQIVIAERQYRNTFGHFTRLISKLQLTFSNSLTQNYAFSITEATSDHLMVIAASEDQGRTGDFVAINQDFQIRANFPLPPPRVEYLRVHALNHLHQLRSGSLNQPITEEGVYRGYFSYEFQNGPESPIAIAVGLRPPVVGLELYSDLNHTSEEPNELLGELIGRIPKQTLSKTGQKIEGRYRKSRGLAAELEIEPIPSSGIR